MYLPKEIPSVIKNLVKQYNSDPKLIQAVADNAKYAILSNNAYQSDDIPLATFLKDFHQISITHNDWWGFSVTLFSNAATGEIVAAFRGTANLINVAEDADLAIGGAGVSAHLFAQVLTYATDIAKKYTSNSITFTGHSLGGALAVYAGLITGSNAVTFNSAPLSFVASASALVATPFVSPIVVTHFRSPGDPLTTVDSHFLISSVYEVPNAPLTMVSGEVNSWEIPTLSSLTYGHSVAKLANTMNLTKQVLDIFGGGSGLHLVLNAKYDSDMTHFSEL